MFNRNNGKFNACVRDTAGSTTNYVLKSDGNSGAALFFALMPRLLENDEFSENYTVLCQCRKDGYSDMAKAEDAAKINRIFERNELTTVDMDSVQNEIEQAVEDRTADDPEPLRPNRRGSSVDRFVDAVLQKPQHSPLLRVYLVLAILR